jgi:hypothetical protein
MRVLRLWVLFDMICFLQKSANVELDGGGNDQTLLASLRISNRLTGTSFLFASSL